MHDSVIAFGYALLAECLYRGPGANWDKVLEYERKQLHKRIDARFEAEFTRLEWIQSFRRYGIIVKEHPGIPHKVAFGISVPPRNKFIIGIDPYAI